MKLTQDQIETLNEAATPGRWVQFHPSFCPEARGTPFNQWDTSHDTSAVLPDGTRYKVSTHKHADDAAFAEALVNAYRNGNLIWKDN